MNNITCDQFRYLFQIYTINYICSNSNIYCDNYCMTHNDCYCFCNNDNNIYCVNRYYYAWKFFLVIFTALFFACFCTCCYNLIKRRTNNSAINYNITTPPPPYTINKNTEKS
jgi:hypothetical protein